MYFISFVLFAGILSGVIVNCATGTAMWVKMEKEYEQDEEKEYNVIYFYIIVLYILIYYNLIN